MASASVLDVLIVFGPVAGYISQYRDILHSRSADGFSNKVSLILLLSNILRVLFWYGRRFELSLLFQSLVMIAAQIALLELITRFPLNSQRGKRFRTPDLFHKELAQLAPDFWNWEDISSYLSALGIFSGAVLLCTMLWSSSPVFVELLGYCATLLESSLGVPQLLLNIRQRSTRGLSRTLIATWLLGDSFKTIMFIVNNSPFQFLICGIIQLVIDCMIIGQLLIFPAAAGMAEPRYDRVATTSRKDLRYVFLFSSSPHDERTNERTK